MSVETLGPVIIASSIAPAVESAFRLSAPLSLPSVDTYIPTAGAQLFSMPKLSAPSFFENHKSVPDIPIVKSMSIFGMPKLETPNLPHVDRTVPGKLAFTHTETIWSNTSEPKQVSFDPGLKDQMKPDESPGSVIVIRQLAEKQSPPYFKIATSHTAPRNDNSSQPSQDTARTINFGEDPISRILPDTKPLTDPTPEVTDTRVREPLHSEFWQSVYVAPKVNLIPIKDNPVFHPTEKTKTLLDMLVKTVPQEVKQPKEVIEIETEEIPEAPHDGTQAELAKYEVIADVNQALRVLELAKHVKQNDESAKAIALSALRQAVMRKGTIHILAQAQQLIEQTKTKPQEDAEIEMQTQTEVAPATSTSEKIAIPSKIKTAEQTEKFLKDDEQLPQGKYETVIFERDTKADKKRKEEALIASKRVFDKAKQDGTQNISGWEIAKQMPVEPQPLPIKSELVKDTILPDGSYTEFLYLLASEGPIFTPKDAEKTVEKRINKAPAVRTAKRKTTEGVTPKDVRRVLNLKNPFEN